MLSTFLQINGGHVVSYLENSSNLENVNFVVEQMVCLFENVRKGRSFLYASLKALYNLFLILPQRTSIHLARHSMSDAL